MPFDLTEARKFRASKPVISDFNKGSTDVSHEQGTVVNTEKNTTVNINNLTINGNVTIINNDNRTATINNKE